MTKEIRVWITLSVLTLSACTSGTATAPELPASVSLGWKLANLERVGPETWRATYKGPGVAHARIWAIPGQAAGLDRVQKWKPQRDTVVFYGDHYFTAVDWTGTDAAHAGSLIRALERAIK